MNFVPFCIHSNPKVIGTPFRGAHLQTAALLQSYRVINTAGDLGDVSDSRRSFGQRDQCSHFNGHKHNSPSNRPDHTGTVLFRDYTRTPQAALCPHKRTYVSEKAWLLIWCAMFVLWLHNKSLSSRGGVKVCRDPEFLSENG